MKKCCVETCINNSKYRVEGTSFHRIPKDENNRKLWLKALNQPNLKIDINTCVCSSHFKQKDMVRLERKTRLLSTAVPSRNIGFSSESDESLEPISPAEPCPNLSVNKHITESNKRQPAEISAKSKDDGHITETNTCQPAAVFVESTDDEYITETSTCHLDEMDEGLDDLSPTEQSQNSSDIEYVIEPVPCQTNPAEIFPTLNNDATITRLHKEVAKLKNKLVKKNKVIKTLQQQVRRSRTRLIKLEARVKELLYAGS